MKNIFVLLLMIVVFIPFEAHAFKWSKCKANYKSWGMIEPQGKDLVEKLFSFTAQVSTEKTLQSSSSTTSYVSSTGHCSAFAKAEEDRNRFIAGTMTELMMESAQGQGEHVKSLSMLYGCPTHLQSEFTHMMKTQHQHIFGQDLELDSGLVTKSITNKLIQNKALRDNCNLGLI